MQFKTQPTIRRRTNGTIDVDHYREAAIIMRKQASIEMMRGARPVMWGLAAAFALLVSFASFTPHRMFSQVALQSAPVKAAIMPSMGNMSARSWASSSAQDDHRAIQEQERTKLNAVRSQFLTNAK